MSLKQDRRLAFKERISLRVHFLMCDACRHCDEQFTLLHKVGNKIKEDLDEETTTNRQD
jgi:hypothetical protein